MSSPSAEKTGRPRSEEARSAILEAAFAILQAEGYEAMAIEQVVHRAGVGKTTIYRWWDSRQALAVEAFFTATQDALSFLTREAHAKIFVTKSSN